MSDAPPWNEASQDHKDTAFELLCKLLGATNRSHDRALRYELRELSVACIRDKTCLNLSDPATPIGQLMMRANARSRKNRWL